ncbi:MAG: hypothetical protein OIF36_04970 [Alphaproteobacteria bacterium]|nr:hypothetical protein [Alphaproteobacteria bacterium]
MADEEIKTLNIGEDDALETVSSDEKQESNNDDLDLEARRKIIEEFAKQTSTVSETEKETSVELPEIKPIESEVSKEELVPEVTESVKLETEDNKIESVLEDNLYNDDMILDSLDNEQNFEEASPEKSLSKIVLLFLVLFVMTIIAIGSHFLLKDDKYDIKIKETIAEKVVVEAPLEPVKNIPAENGFKVEKVQERVSVNKELENLKALVSQYEEEKSNLQNDLNNKKKYIARLEDNMGVLNRRVSSLDNINKRLRKEKQEAVKAVVKTTLKKESYINESNVSSIWKIKSVSDYGQYAIVSMVGKNKDVKISAGDSLVEVGYIKSIKKSDGQWFVVGSIKTIAE